MYVHRYAKDSHFPIDFAIFTKALQKHFYKSITDGPTDRRTDGPMDGQTDQQSGVYSPVHATKDVFCLSYEFQLGRFIVEMT